MTDVADQVVQATQASVATQSLRRFATVERALALLCVTIPAWLILFDEGPESVRGSVSAYFDMTPPQAYYFPLTVASMMFLFNGIVKTRRFYNVVLGLLLAGVVLFNLEGATRAPHYIFAIGFFGLNVAVILWFSQDVEPWLRTALAVVILGAVVCWAVFPWFTTFYAEWVSLIAIAIHFVFDSIGLAGYSTATDRATVS